MPQGRGSAGESQPIDIRVSPSTPDARKSTLALLDPADLAYRVLRARPGLTGVMHYFSLDQEWAERFLELGFHISFAGLVTRATRDGLREVARACPADRLLLETDSPFGQPATRKREPQNRPAFLVDTARVVAELRGISLEELAEIEFANAISLFKRIR